MKLLLAFAAVALLAVSCSALWHGEEDGGPKLLANSRHIVAQKINLFSFGDDDGGTKLTSFGDKGGGLKVDDVSGCSKSYANRKGDDGGGPKLNARIIGDVDGGPKASASGKRRKAVYSEIFS